MIHEYVPALKQTSCAVGLHAQSMVPMNHQQGSRLASSNQAVGLGPSSNYRIVYQAEVGTCGAV